MAKNRRQKRRRLLAAVLCVILCAAGIWGVPRLIRLLTAVSGDYAYIVLPDGTAEIRNGKIQMDNSRRQRVCAERIR